MIRFRTTSLLILFMVFFLGHLAFAAKAPECVKDGKKYGVLEENFVEQWFSYQKRGDSYAAGECWDAALADYEKAIELRTAQDRAAKVPGCDSRRARTMGMHIEEWFGHRGKGIALYNLGKIDEAIKELEFSLQCTESSQAQFYLDKAKAAKMKTSSADQEDPKVAAVRLLKNAPRLSYLKTGTPGAASGYDKFVAVPYYFTQDLIDDILENLDSDQKKDKDYVKSLTQGWGYQVISWKAADEVPVNGVREGKLYLIIESSDDQGVQFVAAGETKSPYTFAQKNRADVFPLSLKPAAEGLTVEGGKAETDQETEDLFTIALDETQGKVSLNLMITDLMGKTAQKLLDLTIDREGPQVSVDEVKKTPEGKAEIKGQIVDPSGIKSFTMGGSSPKIAADGKFALAAALDASGGVSFSAEDKVGNVSEGVISLAPPEGGGLNPRSHWARWLNRLVLLASSSLDLPADWRLLPLSYSDWSVDSQVSSLRSTSSRPEPVEGKPQAYSGPSVRFTDRAELHWSLIAAAPPAKSAQPAKPAPSSAPARPAAAAASAQGRPPVITLKTKAQNIYLAELKVEGSVATVGGSKLKTVMVAGTNVLQGQPQNAFFNKAVSLRPGRNTVSVKAVDLTGLSTEQAVSVVRMVPQVQSVAERLAVSMLPFYQDPKTMDLGSVAADNLATALIQQKRFRYVDRSKVDAVLRELKLSGMGLTDPSTAVRAGKQTGAEAIIIGIVRETPTSLELKAQVVDVETSRIMVTQDAYNKDKSLSNLKFLTQGLAVKLQNSFPIVQGNVSQAQGGKTVTIALGQNNRIFAGMRVIFFKVIPKTNAQGQAIGAETQKIGEGKVTGVGAATSTVETFGIRGNLTQTDLVITK